VQARFLAGRLRRRLAPLLVAAALLAAAPAASGAEPPWSLAGKQVTLIVYSSAGGTYDIYARLLARHMPKHLPGKPVFVVKNMLGAGGIIAARYLSVSAPKDGLTIGTIGRGLPFEAMLGSEALDFDPLAFTWIGSMNKESSLALAWHTAAVKTARDLFQHELLIASTSAGSDNQLIPAALNGLIGTRFKIVSGYATMGNAELALESGEVEGIGYWAWVALKSEKPDWLAQKKVNLLFQTALTPHPDLPDVPPPGLAPERAAVLRAAFDASMRDPELLEDARKIGLEINPATAAEIEALLRRVQSFPSDVVRRTKAAMNR
jgi:tripartite-type tricarboxylate transporter receptor subunit TctC